MNSAVKSAVRVLDLLEFFSVSEEPMGVSELSRLMLIPKSSMQALLGTLVARGYLERVAGGYQLSTQQKEQGWVGGALARLRKVADPVMADLVAKTGESVFLSVLAPNHEMKFIAKAISHTIYRFVNVSDPAVKDALIQAARKVRELFPTTTTTTKDTE